MKKSSYQVFRNKQRKVFRIDNVKFYRKNGDFIHGLATLSSKSVKLPDIQLSRNYSPESVFINEVIPEFKKIADGEKIVTILI